MNRKRTTPAVLCLLMTLAISGMADQQVVYPPSAMPRVDMHTHMDAKTQYAKAVEAMDQWGGTLSISLAGLFWVKDNNGSKAREFYIKYRDRILFGSDVFAAGGGASGFLNERKVLETNQVTSGLHGGPKLEAARRQACRPARGNLRCQSDREKFHRARPD